MHLRAERWPAVTFPALTISSRLKEILTYLLIQLQINVDPGPLSCNKSVCAAPGGWEFRCVSLTPPPTEGGLSPPHPACLNASRSAQNCPPGGWLCADMSLPAAAGIFLSAREPDEILGPVEGDDEEDPADGGNRTAVIAVIAATTTRGQQAPTLASVPLLSTLVPSMLDTAEPGFEYWLMVAYDVGDPFYDNRTARAAAQALFAARAADARAATGVTARLALVRFLNAQRKPGPAFNYVAAAAFRDGADYFYRVNDDSIFVSPWARSLVGVLLAFRPPNLGVVGPTCLEGKRSILTHDFTHRAHQRLFDTYYPPALADWWMDDWITAVYPGSNTYRHRGVVVRHRLFHHRYKIDKSHRLLLPSILLATRRAVRDAIEACSPGPCPLLRAAGDRPPPAGVGPARLDRRSFRDYDLHFAILRNVSALANRSLAHNMSSLRLAAAAANAAAAAGGRRKRRPRERRPRPRLLRPEAAGAPGGQAERLAGQDSR